MEIQNCNAFYKRFRRVERKAILHKESSVDSSVELERECISDRKFIKNFNRYNNDNDVRTSNNTIKSPVMYNSEFSSINSMKNHEPKSSNNISRLERMSKIFSVNKINHLKEVRFNTCESYDCANEGDTDEEILASAANKKYCENFNVTFEDGCLANTKDKRNNKSAQDKRSKMCCSNTIIPIKNKCKCSKKINKMISCLSKKHGISNEEALNYICN